MPPPPARGIGPPVDPDTDLSVDPADGDANPEVIARAVCLRLLTGTPKTRAQLAGALDRRHVPEDAAQSVLDRLTDVGLVDDAGFARDWVSSRQARKGLSRRSLIAELRSRGVSEEVIAESVAGIGADEELASAKALVSKKLASMRGVDAEVRTRRLAAMLARKGYSGDMALAAVRSVVEEVDTARRAGR